MKKILIILFLFLSLFGNNFSYGQLNSQSASQLAFKYFRDKEFKPASTLFYELFSTTKSRTYLNYYIQCLTQLKEYKDAEKFVLKQIKKNPTDKTFFITLGNVYEQWGRTEDARLNYDKAIGKLAPAKSEINSMASAFIAIRKYEYANKTYQKGSELLHQPHAFHFEIANNYLYQKNFELMVKEYLIALSIDQSKTNLVQNRLQSALFQDFNASLDPILKNQLLEKIQSDPANFAFKELLQWYFMQKKQFSLALTQAKSIDLLKKEDGYRLLALAVAARNNKDFGTAVECYQLVKGKGNTSRNLLKAQMGELETRFQELNFNKNTQKEQWENLSKLYDEFFLQNKNFALVSASVIEHAHIQAFHLNEFTKAISSLEKALQAKSVHPQNKQKLKMELADIRLFAEDKWDAILLYSQIEKANKNNPIGFEAKFKKAKVSYYMGEFEWAKAQLDAIKGSTSKLIANDAIALAQLIDTNSTLDTSYTALKKYAEAEFRLYQNKDSLAIELLDDLLRNHPSHSLSDEALFKKYEIYYKNDEDEKALEQLDLIIKNHAWDILAAKAHLKQAELFEKKQEKEKAMNSYKNIITEYPESIYSVEARERLNLLKK